jgi:hypothetical protein
MIDLARQLGTDTTGGAAEAILAEQRPFVVCTGFPVKGSPETDGPPGAIALVDGLLTLGKRVRMASYAKCIDIIRSVRPGFEYIEIPIGPLSDSQIKPLSGIALITVEICGRCDDGTYRNMHGKDISNFTPHFEDAFGLESLISIGDGGNEYGMGAAGNQFFMERPKLRRPVSTSQYLIPATVSNYGCYSLLAELQKRSKLTLLPLPHEHVELIRRLVTNGMVDGFSEKQDETVDGEPLSETAIVLEKLQIT